MAAKLKNSSLSVESLTHDEASRKNIPTAECQPVMRPEDETAVGGAAHPALGHLPVGLARPGGRGPDHPPHPLHPPGRGLGAHRPATL